MIQIAGEHQPAIYLQGYEKYIIKQLNVKHASITGIFLKKSVQWHITWRPVSSLYSGAAAEKVPLPIDWQLLHALSNLRFVLKVLIV